MPKHTGTAPAWAAGVALLTGLMLGPAMAGGGLFAQETREPLLPAGRLRFEFAPVFLSWDSRFGERSVDGGLVEEVEPLGHDLDGDTGRGLFPGISELETNLRELVDDPTFQISVGRTRAQVTSSQVRIPLGMELGITDWLTLGVMVPLVQSRTEVTLALRADSLTANLGVSPAVLSSSEVIAFTEDLDAGAQAAAAVASQLCGVDPSSAACRDAAAVAAVGAELHSGFLTSYGASPFYPLEGSPAAEALLQRLVAFEEGLVALGLDPLARQPLFASGRLTPDEFDQLFTNGAVGLGAVPLEGYLSLWELGDIEVQATVKLLGGTTRDTTAATGFDYLVGGGLLVRLATGTQEDPDLFLDVPSGDAQTDVEGRLFANVRRGRINLWGDVRYGIQQPTSLVRRVGPPELVLVPAVNRATVEWTPGNYFRLELVPRLSLTDQLSFTTGYRLFTKARDAYTRISPAPELGETAPIPSPPLYTDVSLLAAETEETVHELSGGLLYSTVEASRAGLTSFPFEVWFGVRRAIAGAGGRTPKTVRATVGLRLYRRFWGD